MSHKLGFVVAGSLFAGMLFVACGSGETVTGNTGAGNTTGSGNNLTDPATLASPITRPRSRFGL